MRIAREAERDAAEYARDVLLTPRSRRTAGVMERKPLDDQLEAVFGPLPGKFDLVVYRPVRGAELP